MTVRVLQGDCREVLATLPEASVQCCVTSPPYWGLRDYGVDGQLGLEGTPQEYVERMVEVFAHVGRVLRADGTLWLNLGDSYAGGKTGRADHGSKDPTKPKDLVGIPWRVAFALQAAGWYLRSDIIWHKPNPMPESVTDRPTKAHEYIFLLSKSERYYFDSEAMKESAKYGEHHAKYSGTYTRHKVEAMQVEGATNGENYQRGMQQAMKDPLRRNKRSVWEVATQPFSGAHFATFPPALIEPCILAGCPEGGTVLDPFGGAGTTGLVADRLQRNAILIELNPEYAAMARRRIEGDAPLFAEVE